MKKFVFIIFIAGWFPANAGNDPKLESKVHGWIKNRAQLYFLENKGQMADLQGKVVNDLLFKASAGGVDMYVTSWGLSYVFTRMDKTGLSKHSASNKSQSRGLQDEN